MIQITLCRQKRQNKNGSIKEQAQPFLNTGSNKSHSSHPKKRKKVPGYEMLESSGSLSSLMLPILSWKLKIIASRGSSTIHQSSKLELLCRQKITFWHHVVTKTGFDLTFQKCFVSFPDENSRKSYLKCRPLWLGDIENFSLKIA